MIKTKICSKCGKEKEISEFRHDKYSKDGYTTRCKYCIDHKYKNTCLICGKDFLGSHKSQFLCSNECRHKYQVGKNNGGFKNAKIECECMFCGNKFLKFKSATKRRELNFCSLDCSHAYFKGKNSPNYKNGLIKFKCEICGKEVEQKRSEYYKHKNHFCSSYCLGKYKTLYCIGENNANWRGGKSEGYNYISSLLRNYCKNRGWLSESIKKQNGKCLFTGLKFECVHHIHSFSSILKETLDKLNFELKNNPKDYKNEDIILLKDNILKIHNSYGYGICLTYSIHELFHKNYGYGDNTKEQFLDFITRYFHKEFDEKLDEKYKSINSAMNYEEVIKIITSFCCG